MNHEQPWAAMGSSHGGHEGKWKGCGAQTDPGVIPLQNETPTQEPHQPFSSPPAHPSRLFLWSVANEGNHLVDQWEYLLLDQ